MIYRARASRAPSAWIADCRARWSGSPAGSAGVSPAFCPGFFRYKGFVGCPAWAEGRPCTYCFLRTTFRTDPELRRGVCWVDPRSRRDFFKLTRHVAQSGFPPAISSARAAVQKWLLAPPHPRKYVNINGEPCGETPPRVLNAGELADSLAFPPEQNPHIGMFLDLFSDPNTNPHGHRLLLLTKAGNKITQDHLAGRKPSPNVILSWSVGNVWGRRFEPGMPPLDDRLSAAHLMLSRGWRVRLRLDPLLWDDDARADLCACPEDHAYQVAVWFSSVRSTKSADRRFPEIITLGSLRHRGGRQRLPAAQRIEIYRAAIQGLHDGGYQGPVGLCKETPEVLSPVLSCDPTELGDVRCNCLP